MTGKTRLSDNDYRVTVNRVPDTVKVQPNMKLSGVAVKKRAA